MFRNESCVFVFIATCIYAFPGLRYWATDVNFQCNRSHQRAWNHSDCTKTWRAVPQGHSAFTGKSLCYCLCVTDNDLYVHTCGMALLKAAFHKNDLLEGTKERKINKKPVMIEWIALNQRLGTRLLESWGLECWVRVCFHGDTVTLPHLISSSSLHRMISENKI